MKMLDENDSRYLEIEQRLRAVIAELDDDFLKRVTETEWAENTEDSHWYDAVLQMMYCIIASYGVGVDEFFGDWVNEPHNVYLLREFKRRKESGIYPAKKFDGMNRTFNRKEYYGMHGGTSK
jgi:hypothetical protein